MMKGQAPQIFFLEPSLPGRASIHHFDTVAQKKKNKKHLKFGLLRIFRCVSTNVLWTRNRDRFVSGQTLHVLSPDGSTFVREMTSWPPHQKSYSIKQCSEQSPKFHANPIIWNECLRFFCRGRSSLPGCPNRKNDNKNNINTSSDMGPAVPGHSSRDV